jgi:hypothetical protein
MKRTDFYGDGNPTVEQRWKLDVYSLQSMASYNQDRIKDAEWQIQHVEETCDWDCEWGYLGGGEELIYQYRREIEGREEYAAYLAWAMDNRSRFFEEAV